MKRADNLWRIFGDPSVELQSKREKSEMNSDMINLFVNNYIKTRSGEKHNWQSYHNGGMILSSQYPPQMTEIRAESKGTKKYRSDIICLLRKKSKSFIFYDIRPAKLRQTVNHSDATRQEN